MTDAEFDAYHEAALKEFEAKQENLTQKFGLGTRDRYQLDFETETLQFLENDVVVVSCSFTAIGSHSSEQQYWKWAWANESLPAPVREKSSKLKELSGLTSMTIFQKEAVKADDELASGFLALACKFLGSCGGYTIPSKSIRVYLALDEVRSEKAV